jgi:hypothetical protein
VVGVGVGGARGDPSACGPRALAGEGDLNSGRLGGDMTASSATAAVLEAASLFDLLLSLGRGERRTRSSDPALSRAASPSAPCGGSSSTSSSGIVIAFLPTFDFDRVTPDDPLLVWTELSDPAARVDRVVDAPVAARLRVVFFGRSSSCSWWTGSASSFMVVVVDRFERVCEGAKFPAEAAVLDPLLGGAGLLLLVDPAIDEGAVEPGLEEDRVLAASRLGCSSGDIFLPRGDSMTELMALDAAERLIAVVLWPARLVVRELCERRIGPAGSASGSGPSSGSGSASRCGSVPDPSSSIICAGFLDLRDAGLKQGVSI